MRQWRGHVRGVALLYLAGSPVCRSRRRLACWPRCARQFAAPAAAALGPEVTVGEPQNGYVGRLEVSPNMRRPGRR